MTALEHLSQLAIQDNQRRFPLSWDGSRSLTYFKPKYSDKTEKGLKKCIEDFCEFTGHFAESIQNKGTRIDERQVVENVIGQMKTIGRVRWNYSSQTKGTSDMQASIRPKDSKYAVKVAIEIKLPGDRMRPAQLEYKKKIEDSGGVYITVSSFEDFLNWFNSFTQ